MRKIILAGVFLLLNFTVFSQIRYEKGFITDNEGKEFSCLILNEGWLNNPVKFIYKLSENSTPKTGMISNVGKFSFENGLKYERLTVDIDRSYPNSNGYSYSRAPKWSKENLFLEVLVEGNNTLYLYRNGNDLKFFYKTGLGKVKQLLYKEYKTMDDRITKNLTYIDQLYKEVNCSEKSILDFKTVKYNETDMSKYFISENKCSDPDFKVENKTYQKANGDFNIKPYVGMAFSSLSIYNLEGSDDYNISFNNQIGVKLGLEFEYVLPVNKNKWSFFLDMNYISYKATFTKKIENGNEIVDLESQADLKALQLPLGIRYYVFLNDNSKIYFDAGFNYAIFMDSKIFISETGDLNIESSKGMFGSIGYTYKNKYTIDFSYQNGDILNRYLYRDSDFNMLSLNFKYTVF